MSMFVISKEVVWRACKSVKANRGAPGIDEQSIANFEPDLYKLWNRMSQELFPPAGSGCANTEEGGEGVEDARRAQGRGQDRSDGVAMCLEPEVEPVSHPDSCWSMKSTPPEAFSVGVIE